MTRSIIAVILIQAAVISTIANASDVDVTKFGVRGDGTTSNTTAIQKVVDACSIGGGGTVHFPAGRYLTGTIQLKDGVMLHLDENAVIVGSSDKSEYRNLEPFTSGDGGKFGEALIVAIDTKNVGIEGTGSIDGQAKPLAAGVAKTALRPFLIRWVRCKNITERDVHLLHPSAWTNVFSQCNGATVENLTIRSRTKGLPNTDGIDLDSTANVTIKNCDIESGDDSICIKATYPLPSTNLHISGCTLNTLTSTIKVGTESLGDFSNISFSDCKITGAGFGGISLYSVDGANLHDIQISNITMDSVGGAINFRLGSRLKTFHPGDTKKPPGSLHDISIANVHATHVKLIGILLNGIPDHPIQNIKFENINLQMNGGGTEANAKVQLAEKETAYPEVTMFGRTMPAYGIYARHIDGITFDHVQLHVTQPDARPATVFIDTKGLSLPNFVDISSPTTAPEQK
jgi:polygalacturonase